MTWFLLFSVIFLSFWQGVLLALLEKLGYILPMCDDQGTKITVEPGTISAGYQNFLVCIEMFFAAIALRYAFPISVYLSEGVVNGSAGRSVTMQSISSSLKVNNNLTWSFCKDFRKGSSKFHIRSIVVSILKCKMKHFKPNFMNLVYQGHLCNKKAFLL